MSYAPVQLDDIAAILQPSFGLPGFRPGQSEAIETILDGNDLLAVMPTGAGKSLCFQAPAVAHPGLTLVVSPLIALMKDQVDGLRLRGIRAGYLASGQSTDERRETLRAISQGDLDLLYVSPERLRDQSFIQRLARAGVWLVAVDEAHCISTWGSDFRPDYLRIPEAIQRLPERPVIAAFTATATRQVRDDIVDRLGLENPGRVLAGFDRPNLRFEVKFCSRPSVRLDELVRQVQRRKGTGIVYSGTRKATEEQAAYLQEHGRSALPYHAGLSSEQRTRAQEAFMSGDIEVICATNAFGLGIDKPDVRFVIHTTLPPSPDAYYQEAGRAGRDGLPSDALMLYLSSDRGLQEWLIDADLPNPGVLSHIHRYVVGAEGWIDVDALTNQKLSGTTVRVALQMLAEAGAIHVGERVGSEIAVRALTATLEQEHHAGIARATARQRQWRVEQLDAVESFVMTDECRRAWLLDYFGDPDVEPRGDAACCDRCARPDSVSAGLAARRAAATKLKQPGRLGHARAALRHSLMETGNVRETAAIVGKPPKKVAEDALKLISEGHLHIRYVVPVEVVAELDEARARMDEAGIEYRRTRPGYLQTAMRFCPQGTNWDHLRFYFAWVRRSEALGEVEDIEPEPVAAPSRPAVPSSGSTSWRESLAMYESGLSVVEIAEGRGIKPKTVDGHLLAAVTHGKLDRSRLVDPDTEAIIRQAIEETPPSDTPLRDIRARAQAIAGRDISYLEISAVRAGQEERQPDGEVARLLERKRRAEQLRQEHEQSGKAWPERWETEYQRILAALDALDSGN